MNTLLMLQYLTLTLFAVDAALGLARAIARGTTHRAYPARYRALASAYRQRRSTWARPVMSVAQRPTLIAITSVEAILWYEATLWYVSIPRSSAIEQIPPRSQPSVWSQNANGVDMPVIPKTVGRWAT